MENQVKNKFIHIATLERNPLSDQNNIQRLKKELEWVNTADFTFEDWKIYHQVFK